jgi:hypothetical protein
VKALHGMPRRRVITMGLAGANLAAVSLILLLPGLAGASQQETVLLSVLIVSVQAGQAVVVQVGKPLPNKGYFTTLLALTVLLVTAICNGTLTEPSSVLVSAALAVAGVLFGTYIGAVAQVQLARGNAASYQLVLLTRSVLWGAVLALVLVLTSVGVLYASLVAWVLMTVLSIGRAPQRDSNAKLTLTILIGAAAGLLYRNDVSLARAAAFGDWFHVWNVSLVIYTISQSMLGFVVVNELFSRRTAVVASLTPRRANIVRLVVACCLPMLVALGVTTEVLVAPGTVSVAVQTALLVLAGSLVAAQASLTHITSASWLVYVAGAIGFCALILSYAAGAGPAVGLLLELGVSGLLVALGTLILHLRAGSRPVPPS